MKELKILVSAQPAALRNGIALQGAPSPLA
jgi:hypothetical protein